MKHVKIFSYQVTQHYPLKGRWHREKKD